MTDAAAPVPGYDRSRVRVGIVHLGVGRVHRSHQAVHPDGFLEARVVGSVVEHLLAPDDPGRVVERMADPAVRIVSLTLTEGGCNTTADGGFDATVPAIVADLASPQTPATAFGLVVEALRRRRERGVPSFTVMSCDNVPGNGAVARRAFAGYAALRDPELGRFVEQEVAFPDSVVDRIAPATADADRAEPAGVSGVQDAWPVVCEPSSQWVLEVADARAGALVAAPGRQREDPLALLREREVFGDLADDEGFAAVYTGQLASLHQRGVRATVESLVRRQGGRPAS